MPAPALIDELNPEVEAAPLAKQKGAVQLLLDLEKAGAATPTSLQLPSDITYAQFEGLLGYLGTVNRRLMWYIGDAVLFGEGAFTEQVAQAVLATGLNEGTILNRVYVCRNIPPSRRIASLSFGTHEAVSALPAREQRYWLEKAAKQGWTRQQLRQAMAARRKDDKPQLLPPSPGDVDADLLVQAVHDLLLHAEESGENVIVRREDVARVRAALGEE